MASICLGLNELTLHMLNYFEETYKYICLSCHDTEITQVVEIIPHERKGALFAT